jgi:hypothetical protein
MYTNHQATPKEAFNQSGDSRGRHLKDTALLRQTPAAPKLVLRARSRSRQASETAAHAVLVYDG